MTLTRQCFFAVFAVALMLGITKTGGAGLLVYEPFDYPDGTQLYDPVGNSGVNGGGGFAGAWTARDFTPSNVPSAAANVVQTGSLAHPTQAGDLPTLGGHAFSTGEFGVNQPARDFNATARSLINNASTIWISFLAERQGTPTDPGISNLPNNPYPRGVNVSFFNDVDLNTELVGIGNSSNATDNTWSIIPRGGGGDREGAYDPAGGVRGGGPENVGAATFPWNELQWAVIRIDQLAGNDNIYLWLSPDPTAEPNVADADATILGTEMSPPTSNGFDYSGIGALRPFLGNAQGTPGMANERPFGELVWDELRVGTSYADMTSTSVVPEPSALMLLALGCLAGLARRRG
jgi:hypothetical protein